MIRRMASRISEITLFFDVTSLTMDQQISIEMQSLDKISRFVEIAELSIQGPRSIMFPDDPDGISLWFDPIVHLAKVVLSPKHHSSVTIFKTPNLLWGSTPDPFIVRHASWNALDDLKKCESDQATVPSIIITYKTLDDTQIDFANSLLLSLDSSISQLGFPVEGLGIVGDKVVDGAAGKGDVYTNVNQYRLLRITSFLSYECEWISNPSMCSIAEQCWNSLYDYLTRIITDDNVNALKMSEKYD